MTEFFLNIVNMSISASWLVFAVLLLRLLLKKAPKWINVLLWGVVAVRLICPFSFESVLSLIPSPQTINPEITLNSPVIDSGVTIIDNVINPIISEATISIQPEKDINLFQFIMPYLAGVWLVGIATLLIYTLISFLRLKSKIGTAVLLRDNIYQSETVVSPFVLGIIKPKIYLPFNMSEQDMEHVIAHEKAHLGRKDHLWKPLGFLILALHWFNPMIWLGYILLCRDIELACDEKVVKELNNKQRADYSQALLTCSVNRRMIAACPLAFGELGVKDRVKSVLNYKKPAFWIIVVAIIVSIIVAVCFLTNPLNSSIYNSRYETGKCIYSYVVSADKETKSNELVFDITSDGKVYKTFGDGTTDELGVLKESDYTAGELETAMKNQDEKLSIGNIRNAYELSDCIFLQKSNGTVYIVQFFSDGKIMSVFKLNRIDKSDILNGLYKLSKEIYSNDSYSYVPNFENDRIEIKTVGGMHIYHFTGELLSTGALYEEIKLNNENFSDLFDNIEIWSDNNNHKNLLKNNQKAWYHKTPDDIGGYPYMLLSQKDGTLCMIFADFENGEPTRIRYIYKLEYEGNIENSYESTVGGSDEPSNVIVSTTIEGLKVKYPQFFNVSTDGGLTVYIWQMSANNYSCYLANTSMEAISDNSFAYNIGATIAEMRAILTTYDIEQKDITVQPVINPLSSYGYRIDDAYRAKIKELFWKNSYNVIDYDGSSIPKLNVTCGNASTEASMGTTEWTSDAGNGTMQTINGDSSHPLERIDYLLPLALKVNRSNNATPIIGLNFDVAPDSIKVNSWFFTKSGKTKPFDAEVDGFNIKLNAGKETCVYEVVATWNSSDKYYGTVRYSFCVAEQEEENEEIALIPMVMVDGVLYIDTGYNNSEIRKCGTPDGEITSQVKSSKKPYQNNQSNFGTGYEYQYGATEGTIDICMNGNWRIFATEDVRQKLQFPDNN